MHYCLPVEMEGSNKNRSEKTSEKNSTKKRSKEYGKYTGEEKCKKT